jgi:diguanylate cyclase (GGDEF)-like protein/PAS domain S-box-containing protein
MARTAALPAAPALEASAAQPSLTPEAFAAGSLRTVLDAWPDAVYAVHARELRFLYVNQTACQMLGVPEAEYLRLKVWETIHVTREELALAHERLIAAPGQAERFEFLGRSVEGDRAWMELRRHAVHADGHWLIIAIMRNVTDRKLAEQAADRHKRMYAALSATNEAIMQAQSPTELYERVCNAAVTHGGLISASVLLPDGSHGLMRVEAAAANGPSRVREARISTDPATPEGRGPVGLAYRSGATQVSNDFMRDERTAYWHEMGKASGVKSSAAVPLRRHGAVYGAMVFFSPERRTFDDDVVKLLERMAQNISFALGNLERDRERHQAQTALTESEARFRALTHLSSDWYWEQDDELRYTRFQSRDSSAADVSNDFVGRQPWELSFEIEAGHGPTSFRSFLDEPEAYRDVVHVRTGVDGSRQYFTVSGEPLLDETGRFVGYRGVSKDITPQRLADERIRYLATHDGLTGLPNRAMFSQLLNTEIELSTRNKRLFGLLYVDLDGFKRVNDTLGHDAGDVLLKQMAKRFAASLRGSDTVSRLAGDEFAILVRDVQGAPDLWAIAGKVLAAAGASLDVLGHSCSVSASIGMALFPEHARDELSLMKRADMAMYLAKREGRNRARISGG